MRSRGARHNAREYALRMIYSSEANARLEDSETEEMTWQSWQEDDSLRVPDAESGFANQAASGVADKQTVIDEFIQGYSKNWKLSRISRIDKCVLRLAIYELSTNQDLDVHVIIDEAVELAKCYGDENSSKFVNGILDAVAKDLRKTKDNQLTLF